MSHASKITTLPSLLGYLTKSKKLNEFLFYQGAPIESIFALVSGRVDITTLTPHGRTVRTPIKEGNFINLPPSLANTDQGLTLKHDSHATVMSKNASYIRIPLGTACNDPEILRLTYNQASQALQRFTQQARLRNASARVQLAFQLSYLAKNFTLNSSPDRETRKIEIHGFSNEHLSEILGISREEIGRSFAKFKELGLAIKPNPRRKEIHILDITALDRYVEESSPRYEKHNGHQASLRR